MGQTSTLSELREIERLREKAGHDEAQALYRAWQTGFEIGFVIGFEKGLKIAEERAARKTALDIARKLKEMGFPLDQIARVTELSCAEVENL